MNRGEWSVAAYRRPARAAVKSHAAGDPVSVGAFTDLDEPDRGSSPQVYHLRSITCVLSVYHLRALRLSLACSPPFVPLPSPYLSSVPEVTTSSRENKGCPRIFSSCHSHQCAKADLAFPPSLWRHAAQLLHLSFLSEQDTTQVRKRGVSRHDNGRHSPCLADSMTLLLSCVRTLSLYKDTPTGTKHIYVHVHKQGILICIYGYIYTCIYIYVYI